MNSAWLYVFIGGLFEVAWAIAMDYSEGFTVWYWDVVVVIFLVLSTLFLSRSLKGGLPVGTAYAVWTGIGAVGTMTVSLILGNETLTVLKTLFLALIICGILGLQATSKRTEE